MKFASVLRDSSEVVPDTAELFTLYKQLKKSLKKIPIAHVERGEIVESGQETAVEGGKDHGVEARVGTGPGASAAAELDAQEQAFVRVITEDVAQLNEQYMEKEEVNVIRLGALQEQVASASSRASQATTYRALVNFHGELLLALHWSILAYTGLVKILKKHHKRTGLLLRAPHLADMLGQPFCSVEVTKEMVGTVEALIADLASKLGLAEGSEAEGEAERGAALQGVGQPAGVGARPSSSSMASPSRKRPLEEGAGGGGSAKRCGGEAEGAAGELASDCSSHEEESQDEAEEDSAGAGEDVLRRTCAALHLWEQLQLTASTPSTVAAAPRCRP